MNLSGLFGGGPTPQQSDPYSPNQGSGYNPFDPASFMGSYGDPLSQAENTVSPPGITDPSTGIANTGGSGSQSGSTQSPAIQQLAQALNPNTFMQAGQGPTNIQQNGRPVQGASWIQPAAQSTPNPMFPNWTSPMDPSASGSPSYAGSGPGYTPAAPAAPPARTPTMSVAPPPIDMSTSPDQLPVTAREPAPIYGGSASPAAGPDEAASSGQRLSAPGPGTPTPEMLAGLKPGPSLQADPNDPYGIGVPDISRDPNAGHGATGTWTDDSDESGGTGRRPGYATSLSEGQAPGGPGVSTPSPTPAATTPRDPSMTTAGGGQGGQPLTPDQYRQQYDPNSGMVPPDQYEQLYNQRFGQGGMGGPGGMGNINPMKLIMDFLMGGPQALMQDLQSLSRQVPGGYNYGNQGDNLGDTGQPYRGGYMGGTEAPWLATGGRAPPGTDPNRYARMTPEQYAEYRRTGKISPQSSKISGEKTTKTVPTTRVSGPNIGTAPDPGTTLPNTGGQPLDPFSSTVKPGEQLSKSVGAGIPNVDPRAVMNVSPSANDTPADVSAKYNYAPATSRGDVAYIDSNGGKSTTGYNLRSGSYGAYKMNPEFTRRLAAAGRAYEAETGRKPKYGEGDRDPQTQSTYVMWRRTGRASGPAAAPGHSLHQQGLAMDIPGGPFRTWLGQHAGRFGLGFPLSNDTNHIQMSHQGVPYPYPGPGDHGGGRGQGFAEGMGLSPTYTPSELLANRAYEHRPAGWRGGAYDQFRRSGDVEDRRGENPDANFARDLDQTPSALEMFFGPSGPSRDMPPPPADPNDPMAAALGLGDLYRYAPGPRRPIRSPMS